jgi:predicted dehydrogenase
MFANQTQQSVRVHDANDPYRTMIEAFADAVTGGPEWPHPVERSIEMLSLIERIRDVATT